MEFIKDDGGRFEAGYRGDVGDCVCRSISIATGLHYRQVYEELNALAKRERRGKRKRGISSARNGVYKETQKKYMESLGWKWVPTMGIGSGCKVHLKAEELPKGRLVVNLSKHTTAVVDGIIHDLSDPSRNETRCVYGYFYLPVEKGELR